MYNNHTMLQEDVGCACYSLAVMFHAFPVMRRKTQQSLARPISHTSLEYVEKWDSPAEVGGRRKQQCITTTQCYNKMWDVHVTHALLCSMHS